jgi:hypothetical protein
MGLMLIPSSPETSNDSETRSVDDTIEIDILSKDDYLPNNNSDSFGRIDIVQTGGDAGGIMVFDLLTGILSYRPLLIEHGTTVFITINPLDSFVIPEGFSLNRDGNNEVFSIENSEVIYLNSSI